MAEEANVEPTVSASWKKVEEATTVEDPNFGLNPTIFWMIQSNELNASEVVKALKNKINDNSPVVQNLTLHLLEDFGQNCDAFYSEVASQNLHEDMVRLVDNPQSDYTNRKMAFRLLRTWAESREVFHRGVFRQVYWSLARRVPSDIAGRKSVDHVRCTTLDLILTPEEKQLVLSRLTLEDLTPEERKSVLARLNMKTVKPEEDPFDILERYQPMSCQEKMDILLLEGPLPPKLAEERKKYLVLARKSLESLSSILHSQGEPKPLKECSTLRWLDRCKKSLNVISEILETSSNDELFVWIEAVALTNQLGLVIDKYLELEAAEMNAAQQPQKAGPAKHDAKAVQNLNETETETAQNQELK